MTIQNTAHQMRAGTVTAVELVQRSLAAIASRDSTLGLIVSFDRSDVLAKAERLDEELRSGVYRGPLHGIPITVKDVIAVQGLPTQAQSAAGPERFLSTDEATVARNLREAGAILVAKATTSEFALGLPDRTRAFPIPRNPADPERWTGGSSSGSAGSVAAGYALGSIGTDTGGSIRAPAAYCGVTGFKPSFGQVSRFGSIPLASSLDHIGTIAQTAHDCAILFAAISGPDHNDPATILAQTTTYPDTNGPSSATGSRVGYIDGPNKYADVHAIDAFQQALRVMREAGAQVSRIDLPELDLLATATSTIMLAEGFATHRANLRSHWADYGRPTRSLLAIGALFGADDYIASQRLAAECRVRYDEILDGFDYILSLTCGTAAPLLDDLRLEGVMDSRSFTQPWNALGYPVVSVPIGSDQHGLPIGMQLISRRGRDLDVLRAASIYQHHTDWHVRFIQAP